MRSIFLFIGCLALTACQPSPIPLKESSSSSSSSSSFSSPQAKAPSSASSTASPYTKPSDSELRTRLSPLSYDVTQHEGTEPPYQNTYWDNHEEGIYVDIVSGEVLFSSKDKYDSGTGWPSFTKPLVSENIVERTDYQLIYPRTEVRSRLADSHLGHVFDDGPEPLGLRYCMNSAAMRFIPKNQLKAEGYEEYAEVFVE